MKIGWSILNTPQNWSLDRSVSSRRRDQSVNDLRLVEPLHVQVVHQVVGIVGSLMASGALSFTKEYFLAVKFFRCRFPRVEFLQHVEFGRWRKVQNLLKFSHVVNLAAAV